MNPNRPLRTPLPWTIAQLILIILAGCLPAPTPTALPAQTPPPPTDTATPPPATATISPTPSPKPATATPTSPPSAGYDDVPMIEIPAGEFIMGLSKDQATMLNKRWREDFLNTPDTSIQTPFITFNRALPQMRVYLDSFKIDLVEVTNARYQFCVEAGVCPDLGPVALEAANLPVYTAFIYAQTYCDWVGKRLPTEAEWEKAARGTDGRIFPWGDEWEPERVALEPSPVGSHPEDASPYGVLDMAGNVNEWTQSPFAPYPGYDPGPVYLQELFNMDRKVVRGFLYYQLSLWEGAVTARRNLSSDAGFRCVAGDEPVPLAEAMIEAEQLALPLPPTATAVDLSRMVEIPAGSFLRGVDEQTLQTDDERRALRDAIPQQSVYLDRYYIDRFPVTTAQYAEFLNRLGDHRWGCGEGWYCARVDEKQGKFGFIYENDGYYLFDEEVADFPFPNTNWYGTQDYCAWQGKRLPTEAEWEKAARGTDGRRYPWGEAWDPRAEEREGPRRAGTNYAVGRKPFLASPYGVQDLTGISSAGEWVADWYGESYYTTPGSIDNPQGPRDGELKVRRGGNAVETLGITFRDDTFLTRLAGFRCAYTPPGTQ